MNQWPYMNHWQYERPMLGGLMGQTYMLGPLPRGGEFELDVTLKAKDLGLWNETISFTYDKVRSLVSSTDLVTPESLDVYVHFPEGFTCYVQIFGASKHGHSSATHLKDTILQILRNGYAIDEGSTVFYVETSAAAPAPPPPPRSDGGVTFTVGTDLPDVTGTPGPYVPPPLLTPEPKKGISPLLWLGLAAIAVIAISSRD